MFWPAKESLVTGSTITSVLPDVVFPMATDGESRAKSINSRPFTGRLTFWRSVITVLSCVRVGSASSEKVEVEATSELAEPTRTQVSTVITERQIVNLPVNGREFIDFALLSPSVAIGNTTSGSTDVIVEPVTKLSFAGQNIHYNFIAVDGADDISTASGIQRGTPPQESVQE